MSLAHPNLTPQLTHHTIAVQQVEQILLGVRRQGRPVEPILQRAGISPLLLASPLSRVSQAQYATLIRVLRRVTRDEFWGLLGRPVPLCSFAQGCRLLIHCRTLGEALQAGLQYYHLLIDDFAPRLQVAGGMATVRVASRRPRDAVLDYAERVFAFLAYGLASWLVARRIPLTEVLYADGGGITPRDEVPKMFQAPVRFGQGQLGWRFSAEWLALPVVQNSQSLAEFLRGTPDNLLLRYRDQSSLTERIRRLLRRHLAGELPTLEAVSQSLAMTPQTLRRRLREEGQGFQAIKDDLRRDAAIECLARADLTLLDIALRLGFSEASTFHRAFKHWTGVAPGEYRLRQRDAQDARPITADLQRWVA